MKGLLHRLAARAAGTAVPLRSDARPPFGAAAPAWQGDLADSDGGAERVAAGLVAPPARSEDDRSALEASLVDRVPGLEARAPTDADSAPSDASPRKALARPRRALPGLVRTPGEEKPGSRAADRVPPSLLADAKPHDAGSASLHSAGLDGEATRLAPSPPVRQGAFEPSLRREAAPRHGLDEPARLLPSPGPRRALAPADAEAAAAGAPGSVVPPRAAAQEPTEVHVHIGRLDVTAVHESAPRRRPATAPAPMSLDTYLARRSRA